MKAVALLNQARAAGVELYLTNGQVRYRGPNSVVETLIPELRQHKPALIDLLKLWENLENAINTCCDVHHDTAENRIALLSDCSQESVERWPWLTWYFNQEAVARTH